MNEMAPVLVLCWPMMTLTLSVVFFLGFLLGKVKYERCQRCEDCKFEGQHMMRKKSFWAKELEVEGEVVLHLSRTGTKVHLDTHCPRLNGADPKTLTERRLCKHCMKKGKEGRTYL